MFSSISITSISCNKSNSKDYEVRELSALNTHLQIIWQHAKIILKSYYVTWKWNQIQNQHQIHKQTFKQKLNTENCIEICRNELNVWNRYSGHNYLLIFLVLLCPGMKVDSTVVTNTLAWVMLGYLGSNYVNTPSSRLTVST